MGQVKEVFYDIDYVLDWELFNTVICEIKRGDILTFPFKVKFDLEIIYLISNDIVYNNLLLFYEKINN